MEKEVYLVNPCKTSSLPFWKTNQISIPENMKIVLEENLHSVNVQKYIDEKYFKLVHRMNDIEKPVLSNRYEVRVCAVSEYAKHITVCYDDIGISVEDLEEYQSHAVYDSNLCIAVKER